MKMPPHQPQGTDPLADIEEFWERHRGREKLGFAIRVGFVAVGLGAALISFVIQRRVFAEITAQAAFSFWIVLILESAKVGSHVVYRRGQFDMDVSERKRALVRAFQILLVLLSFTCSLAMISHSLDRPHLEAVQNAELARQKRINQRRRSRLDAAHQETLARRQRIFDQWHAGRKASIQGEFDPVIAELEQLLLLEMENHGPGGEFRGPRYREFQRRLERARAGRRSAMAELERRRAQKEAELNRELNAARAEYQNRGAALAREGQKELERIRRKTYADDERVANALVVATMTTLNHGLFQPIFGFRMSSVVFTTLFSLAIALLLELAIVICVSAVDVSSPPMDFVKKKSPGTAGDCGE